jgi:hypothetical protein
MEAPQFVAKNVVLLLDSFGDVVTGRLIHGNSPTIVRVSRQ